ncbi:MAG: hypothetical protein JW864_13610 [Spirochaetes bacterium]|nr:hypothetical protein [Spirochaetota bacterium]
MKNIISIRAAGIILIISFILLMIFHVLIIFHAVPYNIVWVSRINGTASMIRHEVFALLMLVLFILAVAGKAGFIKAEKFPKFINLGMWIIFIYLLLNTALNITSGITPEKMIFIPVTAILALLTLRLAVEK